MLFTTRLNLLRCRKLIYMLCTILSSYTELSGPIWYIPYCPAIPNWSSGQIAYSELATTGQFSIPRNWHTVLVYRIGIPYWHTVLEYRIGIPYWHTVLECRIGIPYRNTVLVYCLDIPTWYTVLDLVRRLKCRPQLGFIRL